MRPLILAAALALIPAATIADEDDVIRVKSASDVPATVERLVAATEAAGATVFARVDHGAGSRSVGKDIASRSR